MTPIQLLESYFNQLLNGLYVLPFWIQTACVLFLMVCVGAIGSYVWLMPVGQFLQAIAVLFAAWLVFGRWRWGFLAFIIFSGAIWTISSVNPIAAVMVTISAFLLVLMAVEIPRIGKTRDDSF